MLRLDTARLSEYQLIRDYKKQRRADGKELFRLGARAKALFPGTKKDVVQTP